MVQWLGHCASIAGGTGSIPGQGTKILYAMWHGQKKKRERKKNRLVFYFATGRFLFRKRLPFKKYSFLLFKIQRLRISFSVKKK